MIRLMRRFLIVAVLLLIAVPAFGADSELRFDGVKRVVVFADVHGGYQELLSVLRETAIIDESLHWKAGTTHLVSLGDLMDRGPDSRKVLDLLMRLEREARDAGGALHLVLGNHEVMNIAGDLRYVSRAEFAAYEGSVDDSLREEAWQAILQKEPAAGRAEFDAAFPPGYFAKQQAFSPAGVYGSWLLSKPFMIVINDTAFVHAGLSEMVARLGLEGTNETLRTELGDYLQAWQKTTAELGIARPVGFLERPDFLSGLGATEQSAALAAMQRE